MQKSDPKPVDIHLLTASGGRVSKTNLVTKEQGLTFFVDGSGKDTRQFKGQNELYRNKAGTINFNSFFSQEGKDFFAKGKGKVDIYKSLSLG